MIRLLIIADDFTGALDTGVQFAACGAATRVITDRNASLADYKNEAEVLVVDAETRHLPAAEAYTYVASIVSQAVQLDIPHIFKKTDSALRGNIGAELAALLESSGETQLPFLPAFPQMNRCTVDGVHYIAGVPVAESVFGKDPFEPVTHSNISDVIALQSPAAVTSCAVKDPVPENTGILVFDASSLEDLTIRARQLQKKNMLRIMAGCAGFGSVLPQLLNIGTGTPAPLPKLEPNFLVICGSVNPITVAQCSHAESEGFLRIRLAPEQKLNPEYWSSTEGQLEFQNLQARLSEQRCRIIDTNDPGSNKLTSDYAEAHSMTIEDVRQAVSRSIGYLVSRLFPNPGLGTLLITGGDTLLQCMNYMGIREIEPLGELDRGVVLSRFSYQGYTRYVISKSGGFGKETLFTDLAKRIAP